MVTRYAHIVSTTYAFENKSFVYTIGAMARKKRVNLEIGPRHTEELLWLMDRWGLDMTNTLRVIISNAVRQERQLDQTVNDQNQ